MKHPYIRTGSNLINMSVQNGVEREGYFMFLVVLTIS